MDTLTHALSGALLARATAPPTAGPGALSIGQRMLAGAAAAAFPDVDFALRAVDTLTYLNWHQAHTHSLLLMPVWAFALAALFSLAMHRRVGWQACFGVALLGIAIHIAGDLVTAYGTMLFAPLMSQRYSLPLAFLIDPWFTGILALALIFAIRHPAHRWIAGAGLLALGAYVVWLGMLASQAMDIGAAHAQRQNLRGARSEVLPQPLSPLNWKIIVSDEDVYHVAHVRLPVWFGAAWLPWPGVLGEISRAYAPVEAAVWNIGHRYGGYPEQAAAAGEAWRQPLFANFRTFARYPALDRLTVSDEAECAWFADLRFALPALTPSFRYGMCREKPHGDWRLERLRGDFLID